MVVGKPDSDCSSENDRFAEETRLYSLNVLQLIRSAQMQHGLRHGDYQRYRQYCTRKLARLRKSLKWPMGNKHGFKAKEIKPELVTDVRFMVMPLFCAERAWSYAMELKVLANSERRRHFHMMRKLSKATKSAEQLMALVEKTPCDAKTNLEVQAYASWMEANWAFETQDWQQALDLYTKTRTIYEGLSKACDDEGKKLYVGKMDEVFSNIRYCAYKLGIAGVSLSELTKLRVTSPGMELLSAQIESTVAQERAKMAVSITDIVWLEHKVPVKNQKARVCILRYQDRQSELDKASSPDEKMSFYDVLLMDCKETSQQIKEEMLQVPNSLESRIVGSGEVTSLQPLLSYLSFMRHMITVERNLLMVEQLESGLVLPLESAATTFEVSFKSSKPEEFVKLFDNILQSLQDILQMPGVAESGPTFSQTQARILWSKAFRCFYVALALHSQSKWKEASCLYRRVTSYIDQAISAYSACPVLPNHSENLRALRNKVGLLRGAADAALILDQSNLDLVPKESFNKPLIERLDLFCDDVNSVRRPLVVPPTPVLEPVASKPLFFDVALSGIELPDLSQRINPQTSSSSGGLTGLVKGLWSWGSRK